MLSRILLAVLVAFVLIAPTAAAVTQDGPMKGSCITIRGLGVAVTLAHCMPDIPWLVETLEQVLCGPSDCEGTT